jgi:hypothetical protein
MNATTTDNVVADFMTETTACAAAKSDFIESLRAFRWSLLGVLVTTVLASAANPSADACTRSMGLNYQVYRNDCPIRTSVLGCACAGFHGIRPFVSLPRLFADPRARGRTLGAKEVITRRSCAAEKAPLPARNGARGKSRRTSRNKSACRF